MAIKINDKKLHRETMKKIDSYYDKAAKAYERGDMVAGKYWEKKSDSLYGRNYGKMFGLKIIKGRWVKR